MMFSFSENALVLAAAFVLFSLSHVCVPLQHEGFVDLTTTKQ